ncbi:outer membrane beta-barrel family protein [Pedobacter nutrimenti]|uniref:Outer membrane receptor protein involved in Fe transport n=1 Tax=Pedobacter nutrimenti TaxID=1241337 RepID=A0A318UN56_9SPHI|nr:outer membrane beta-barrel family protein [Pedobacter nutrimenti]PYF77191.1 outer membrane receptor protein involved in Fe transport [Pedobacter nutrimenti]
MNLFPIKLSFIILFFTCIIFSAYAQQKGQLRGWVKDAVTRDGIPLTSIILSNQKTGLQVKGLQTDSTGNFTIDELPDGTFKCKISYIGYQTVVKDSVSIYEGNRSINLGEIYLTTGKGSLLSEVVITAQQVNTKIGLSKKKFSVDQSLVSKGGSAADLLQNIPTVLVDGAGNVSLRGSSNVNVLIDGKPSLIGGGNITQLLQSLPASSIESIELVTNPSAKYDAEGESGILNIVLKKNKKAGFIGTAEATAGTRNNYNANAGLSFQNKKVNIYGNYSYRYSTTRSNGHQNITFLNPTDSLTFSNETFPSQTINKGHTLKGGMDYYLAEKTVLSFSGSYNNLKTNRNEVLNIDQLNASGLPLQLSLNNNQSTGQGNNYDLNLDFSKTFNRPGEELVLSTGYAHGVNDNQMSLTSGVYNINGRAIQSPPETLYNESDNGNRYYNIKADFTLPIGPTGKIETGYRSQIRLDDRKQQVYHFSDANGYRPDYPFNNRFNSKNQIHALYFNYFNQIKNFSYQIGLRAEAASQTAIIEGYNAANLPTTIPVKVVNNRIYPSITLSQTFKKEQQLQFSYSRRVTRPTMRNLNPIVDISDPVNYDTGNPELKPEDIHLFELAYNKQWKSITLTSGLYYRQTNNLIRHIESSPVNGVITTISENISHAYTSGLELIGHFSLLKGWDFTANTNIYQNKTAAAPEYGIAQSSGWSWNTNITNNLTIGRDISLQVRGDYHAPDKIGPDRNLAIYGIDAGAKLNVWHNSGTITLNGRDVFNTRKWSFLRESNALLLDFERRTIGARASLTFSYRFGTNTFRSKKIEHSTELKEG